MTGRAGRPRVLALSGGVGGAKLALGLARVLPADDLLVIANTGDDFEHLGLHISPDLDTLLYTLSGRANPETGWGRADESWQFLEALKELGGETWFRLGDRDFALHVERTRRLRSGEPLSSIAADVARRFGIAAAVLPMSDDPVRTMVATQAGELALQHYFVRERCVPQARGVRYAGAEAARPVPVMMAALADPALVAVVICPSNPYLSIDPILSLPGVRAGLAACEAPVIAVSPLIGGQAVKGPTAKMMAELGATAGSLAIAAHYEGILDGLVIDPSDGADAAAIRARGVSVAIEPALMVSLADRERLAGACLEFARFLRAT